MPTAEVTDADSRERAADLAWFVVYSDWRRGNSEPMAQWIRDPTTVVVEDAREFLADFLLGKVKRPRGLKKQYSGQFERQISTLVYQARERLSAKNSRPNEAAIAEVAKSQKTTSGTVRGIVQRVHDEGFTFELWKRVGRPTF